MFLQWRIRIYGLVYLLKQSSYMANLFYISVEYVSAHVAYYRYSQSQTLDLFTLSWSSTLVARYRRLLGYCARITHARFDENDPVSSSHARVARLASRVRVTDMQSVYLLTTFELYIGSCPRACTTANTCLRSQLSLALPPPIRSWQNSRARRSFSECRQLTLSCVITDCRVDSAKYLMLCRW